MKHRKLSLAQISVITLILLLLFVLSYDNLSDNAYTTNEPLYLYSGYTYLKYGHSFNTNHPLLSGVIASVPLLFMDVDTPPFNEIDRPWEFARKEWLYYQKNTPEKILFWSRLPMLILAILFGIYIFRWTYEMFGFESGIFSLLLYAFFPYTLGFSSFVLTDFPAAGFGIIAFYYFWKYSKEKMNRYLAFSAIFYGLSITSKEITILLIPLFIILPILKRVPFKKAFSDFILFLFILALTIILVNSHEIHPLFNYNDPFYSHGARTPERLNSLVASFTPSETLNNFIKFCLTRIPVPGPHSWQGYLSWAVQRGEILRFVNGGYINSLLYYFYVFLLRLPIPLLIFYLIAGISFISIRKRNRFFIFVVLPTIYFFLIAFIAIRNQTDMRYLLFGFFASFVCLGKIYKRRVFLIILLSWYIFGTLLMAPSFLSYFNEFVGPAQGYKYLTDYDIGQDLNRLSKYYSAHNLSNIYLDYAGFAKPDALGISYIPLSCKPVHGIVAISVTPLQGNFWYKGSNFPLNMPCYEWLRNKDPIARIGYTIFIYNTTNN